MSGGHFLAVVVRPANDKILICFQVWYWKKMLLAGRTTAAKGV